MQEMGKESFHPFEDDRYEMDFYQDDSATKRRKPRPNMDERKEGFKENAERERRIHKERQKARREKDRMDWDAEE